MSRIFIHPPAVRFLLSALPIAAALVSLARPAFGMADCPGGSTCVYLRNSTQSVITFDVEKYYDSDNEMVLGDDYWYPPTGPTLSPGETGMVLEVDDFQEIFNSTIGAFRGHLTIDGSTQSSLYVRTDIDWVTGGATYFLATHPGDVWHDPDTHIQTARSFGNTALEIHARRDGSMIVFTVHDPAGMLGFVPHAAPAANELTIMNYNTFLLMGPDAWPVDKPDYCTRAEKIADVIPDVDVLVLNEVASKDSTCAVDAYDLVTERLVAPAGPFPYRSELLNGDPSWGLLGPTSTGGVAILSKYPIENVYHHEFSSGSGEDGLMQKGFLHVRVTKTVAGRAYVYNIIGTHLQAGDSDARIVARQEQRADIAAYVQGLPAGQPILVVGDLNTSDAEIPGFLTELDATHAGFDDIVRYSASGEQSYYTDAQGDWLDWILYARHGRTPASMYWRYVPMRVVDTDHYPAADLSDHEAVYAYLTFD